MHSVIHTRLYYITLLTTIPIYVHYYSRGLKFKFESTNEVVSMLSLMSIYSGIILS